MTQYTASELYDLSERTRQAAREEPRYSPTGRATAYGEIEFRDKLTGKAVVYSSYFGVMRNARIRNGEVDFLNPSDNPMQGWRP
jgi:hypothetical protein